MGNSTLKADTAKLTHCGQNQTIEYVCMEMKGWRKSMQDAAIYSLQIPTFSTQSHYKNSLFAIFDGHGTSYISRYLSENFVGVLTSLQNYHDQLYVEALEETFKVLDERMLSKEGQEELKRIKKEEDELCVHGKYHPVGERIGDFCGSTANVILVTEKFYYVANCGDSRSILCRSGFIIELSKDHKPSLPEQIMRIRKAHGYVNHGRINDMLSVSRAFGDFDLKQQQYLSWSQQIVTSKPDIESFAKSSRDDFILMGCDGIWQNSQQSKQIIQILIKTKHYKKKNYQSALSQFMNKLIAKDEQQQCGQDNMTAIFIKLNNIAMNGSERDKRCETKNCIEKQ